MVTKNIIYQKTHNQQFRRTVLKAKKKTGRRILVFTAKKVYKMNSDLKQKLNQNAASL